MQNWGQVIMQTNQLRAMQLIKGSEMNMTVTKVINLYKAIPACTLVCIVEQNSQTVREEPTLWE